MCLYRFIYQQLSHLKLEEKMFDYFFIHLKIIKTLHIKIQNIFYEKL